MKIVKLVISVIVVVLFISVFGCGAPVGPREDEITEAKAEEVAEVAGVSWKAPSGGEILIDDMAAAPKDAGPFVIAHAINDTEGAWGTDVWDGFEEAAKEYSKLELHQFDCKNNPDDSLKAVLDIQTLNPDLVIYFNWVGAGQEMAKWCEENEKPEIEIDVPYGDNAWFYGVNNPMTGILGGEKMGEWVKENWAGEEVTIVQNTEYESGEDVYLRNSEFLRVFIETVGDSVTITNLNDEGKVDELNGDTSPELGLELMSSWLTANPDADHIVIWSMTDEACAGMYAAVKNANRLDQCVFGSINGTPNAFNIIAEDERYLGSIAIFPELYGQGVLKMAMNILTGMDVPKKVVTKYDWITLDNLGDYYPEYFE